MYVLFRDSLGTQLLLEVVKARARSVFCSNSWALAEPVAGLALAERLTERTLSPRAFARRSSRGKTYPTAPMLPGSSCTQTISRALGCSAMAAAISVRGSG